MKKIAALAGAVALAVLGLAASAGAQMANVPAQNRMSVVIAPSGRAMIEGQVTAVSSSSVSVSSWDGTWTANLAGNTKVDDDGGAAIMASQIKIGDTVIAHGTISASGSLVLNAASVRDISEGVISRIKKVRENVSGKISDLNNALRSFVLTLPNGKSVTVDVSANARVRVNGRSTSTTAELQDGERVHVSGLLNRSDGTLNASLLRALGK